MPEVLHDLNLRNIAGRVAYQFHNRVVAVPTKPPGQDRIIIAFECMATGQPGPDWLPLVEDMTRVTDVMQRLSQPIASSTKILINPDTIPRAAWEKLDDYSWLHSPTKWLWIDFTKPLFNVPLRFAETLSLLIEAVDDGYELLNVRIFLHRRAGDYRKFIHAQYFTQGEGWVSSVIVKNGEPRFTVVNDTGNHTALIGSSDEQIEALSLAAVGWTLDILFLLNCVHNVQLEKIASSSKVPKYARNYPRLAYHVLKLMRRDRGAISPKLKEQLRQSPRQHLRRGHLRRLRAPKFTKPYTWIPPCLVGSAHRGSIVKDYLL